MSLKQMKCKKCKVKCNFEQAGRYLNQKNKNAFGVSWRCPKCNKNTLDIGILGPLVPNDSSCLNCGAEYQSKEARTEPCLGCGLTEEEAINLLSPFPAKEEAAKEAQDLFNQGLIKRSLGVLDHALLEDISLTDAWAVKTSLLQVLGFSEQNMAMLSQALEAGAPSALLISYGTELHNAGKYLEAVDVYKRFLSGAPPDLRPMALANYANTLVAMNKMHEAEGLYREAIGLEPSRPTHYVNYANFFLLKQQWAEGLDMIERGLKLPMPRELQSRMLCDRSYIYAELERGNDALNSAELAIKADPRSLRGHFLRGRALALVGRPQEALHEMEFVLKYDPKNEPAGEARKKITEALAEAKVVSIADHKAKSAKANEGSDVVNIDSEQTDKTE